jgi:serine/threonine protein kinase
MFFEYLVGGWSRGRLGAVFFLCASANLTDTTGEGTFGRVYLVRNQYTRQLFALKVMKKETIIQLNQITHVHNEKQILAALDSGFAVKLYARDLSFVNGSYCSSLM